MGTGVLNKGCCGGLFFWVFDVRNCASSCRKVRPKLAVAIGGKAENFTDKMQIREFSDNSKLTIFALIKMLSRKLSYSKLYLGNAFVLNSLNAGNTILMAIPQKPPFSERLIGGHLFPNTSEIQAHK